MDFKWVKKSFQKFKQKHGKDTYQKMDIFLESLKSRYLEEKTVEFTKKKLNKLDAHNKARQSWKTFVGASLEKLLFLMIEELMKDLNVRIINDKALKSDCLDEEKDLVRRMLEVHFEEYSLLPDADIIIYQYDQKKKTVRIICVLSVKNSFRERFTETPYWKLKLKDNPSTQHIKVFMITPDKDDEMSFVEGRGGKPRKARIVLEYELDCIYMAKEQFDASEKVKNIENLFEDLTRLIEENGIK